MKKISIIIPHHSETLSQIHSLLNSINSQVGINFDDIEILFCCDLPSSPLDDADFSKYSNLLNMRFLKSAYEENPGMSRQICLDSAEGEYAFFCDADDCLYHVAVLRELLMNIENSHADIYRFKFIEEVGSFDNDRLDYIAKPINWVWVFAKAYRKQWLIDNNIRFIESIRWHEDSYFNRLCEYRDPKVIDIDDAVYLWRFSRTSVTRVGNHEYTFNATDEYLDALAKAFEKIRDEYHKNPAKDILEVINSHYYVLLDPQNADKQKYEQIEKCYYLFVKKFANNLFENIPLDIQQFLAQLPHSSNFLPSMSLDSYLKYLREKYEVQQL